MRAASTRTARRTAEDAVIDELSRRLAHDTPAEVRTIVVVGEPGDAARTLVTRGIAERWQGAVVADGRWVAGHEVQLFSSPDAVPAAPPDAQSGVRAIVVAAHRAADLPSWMSGRSMPDPRIVSVGTLSLSELGALMEATLDGPVELVACRTVGAEAGFVAAVVVWLTRELKRAGAFERIDDVWHLIDNPITEIVETHARVQLDALTDRERAAAFRLALAEGASAHVPSDDVAEVAHRMRRLGLVRVDRDGTPSFRSPAVAHALRRLAPSDLAGQTHRALLDEGHPSPHTLDWAHATGHPLPGAVVDRAVQEAADREDWALVLALVARLDDDAPPSALMDRHLHGARAARWLGDAGIAHEHLSAARRVIATAPSISGRTGEIDSLDADVLHYLDDDLDAALAILEGDAVDGDTHVAERFIHLTLAARTRDARALLDSSRAGLRRAPAAHRIRVDVCRTLLEVIDGRPRRALRDTLHLLARDGLSPRRDPRITAEIQSAYATAALASDGPSAYPALARHFDEIRDTDYRPELVALTFARASWALARGDVGGSHRASSQALESSTHGDPSGLERALLALHAATTALLGDHGRAADLAERFEAAPTRTSAVLDGGSHAHLAYAVLLADPDASGKLLERAHTHLAGGRRGFAAEVLHAGVRHGNRAAAQLLHTIGAQLDGDLHRLRVDHAAAVLHDDPIALLDIARRAQKAGLALLAAETAAYSASRSGVPDGVRRRARALVAAFPLAGSLAGHRLLTRAAAEVTEGALGVPLTPREREIRAHIDAGLTNRDIAERLQVSERTIEGHITRLYRKTGEQRRAPARR